MQELDFSLATTEEIIKELSQRAKRMRKKNIAYYGDQKSFAKHIGISHRRYQQFEITGKITLEKFIDVLRGLDVLDEIQELLKLNDEDLFNKKTIRTEIKTKNEINIINIPDIFT